MRGLNITKALCFLALAPVLPADRSVGTPGPRKPLGIYAVVNIKDYLNTDPSTDFKKVFTDLLKNPAVSGIALYEEWSRLNPNPPEITVIGQNGGKPYANPNAYDWSLTDDLFNAAAAWNSKNPSQPKTVQLVITPGFNSPNWLLAQLTSCNFLFDEALLPPLGTTCGKATFYGFVEGGYETLAGKRTPIARDLPMPWDPTYKSAWQHFLTALAARYGSNPALVSIAVAGPTASSEEMMLPADQNTDMTAQISGLSPNDMWLKLLKYFFTDPEHQTTDQAFIDEWEKAIDMYGTIFSGVTLVASTGSGLPELCTATSDNPCAFAPPAGPPTNFSQDCPKQDMDCAAETAILAYFEDPTVGGANAKAVQEDGMKGSGQGVFTSGVPGFKLGVAGIKLVSESTSTLPAPSARILGGAQFATSFSRAPVQEGCLKRFPAASGGTDKSGADDPATSVPKVCFVSPYGPNSFAKGTLFKDIPPSDLISPTQAEYNVLEVYFDGTAAASSFGGTVGTAPMNYVQIYGPDFQAAESAAPQAVLDANGKVIAVMQAQTILEQAGKAILAMAE